MKIFQPVFIIGAARSGTKLFRDEIANHPAIDEVPYDINFIWRLGNEHLPHDELDPTTVSSRDADIIRGQIARFSRNSPILVEKTVSNCLRISFINIIYPSAKYIHIVRNGWDVVESSYRQWQSSPEIAYVIKKALKFPLLHAPEYALNYARSQIKRILFPKTTRTITWGPRYKGIEVDLLKRDLLEVCAIQWSRCVSKANLDLKGISGKDVLHVSYEEFVNQPHKVLADVASFVGVDPDWYIDQEYSDVIVDNVGKGCRTLTEKQKAQISSHIKSMMLMLNYDNT